MPNLLQSLIDKQDGAELVRDNVAVLLDAEQTNQQALAIAASKDPDLWKLRVFLERADPWEQYLEPLVTDTSPIVHVWRDSDAFPGDAGDTVRSQKNEVRLNIDCYGYGISADDGGAGQEVGDQEAALEAQRAVRLVRNILMSSTNVQLQMRGLVWERWIESIQQFQPERDEQVIPHIKAARIVLKVGVTETSPQYEGEPLEELVWEFKRLDTGQVIAGAEFGYPA